MLYVYKNSGNVVFVSLGDKSMQFAKISVIVPIYNVENSNFVHEFWLCTLKIQYLVVIRL